MEKSVRLAVCVMVAVGLAATGCKKGKGAASVSDAAAEGSGPSGKLSLEGMYSYMADAGLIEDCATGVKWRVATEGDNAALESAYSKARDKPGDALLVTVEGRLELREKVDRTGKEKVLIVDRFVRVWPRETCGSLLPAGLEGSNWSLLELNSEPVDVDDPSRAPFLEFNAIKKSAFGFGGCNRFFGSYEVGKQGELELGALGATRMACPDDMNKEQAFFEVLGEVTRYEIHGSKLLLFAGPTLVARFQARNLLQTD